MPCHERAPLGSARKESEAGRFVIVYAGQFMDEIDSTCQYPHRIQTRFAGTVIILSLI